MPRLLLTCIEVRIGVSYLWPRTSPQSEVDTAGCAAIPTNNRGTFMQAIQPRPENLLMAIFAIDLLNDDLKSSSITGPEMLQTHLLHATTALN